MSNANQETKDVSPKNVTGRRRFVRGVGIAVPVALTVQARSALACTCSTVSAHASIALANSHNATGDVNVGCAGVSPQTWGNYSGSYTGKTKNFGDVFSPTVSPLTNMQMKDAVKHSDEFVRVMAAGYLNLVNDKVVGFYDLAKLQNMWKGRSSGFVPIPESPTNLWYESQIKTYLIDTWT